jgi:hypothetical protein
MKTLLMVAMEDLNEKYSEMLQRLEKLESMAHPCKELHEFDVWPELDARIKALEHPEWDEFGEET